VTGWLLEGRWFTIGTEGQITAWSPAAAERFGWQRKDVSGKNFIDALLGPDGQAAGAEAVAAVLDGSASDHAGYTGEIDAVDVNGGPLRAAFALVPIQLSVGYEFNDLLQEISGRAGGAAPLSELKGKHESVLSLIESALSGKAAESAQTEEGGRLAGALVVFRAAAAGGGAAAPARPDNVVSIADAAGLDEARSQLEHSRTELEEARVEVRNLQGQLDEARRGSEDARAAAESARIRSEEAQREADSMRAELREARESVHGAMGQAAEVETLRERLGETQRELGTMRAELEAARAELTQGSALSERRGSEAERLRAELEEARAEAERLTAEFNRKASESGAAAFDDERLTELRVTSENAERAAADARAEAGRHAAEVETLRERLQETQRELGTLRAELEAARAEREQAVALAERRGAELERVRGELGSAQVAAVEHVAGDDAVEVVDGELAGDEAGAAEDAQSVEALRLALAEDRFELHAQPVLDLRTNEVSQYELLIRMVVDGGRLILPQAFLEPARRAGLAHAVDHWVVRRAIRLLAIVPDEVALEVNLSPDAAADTELPRVIEEELAATPVDPGRLVLEVTGASAAEDVEATNSLAKRIRNLGCRFALDDFRSTFGSFRLLKDLPLDYLKLDGELVGSLAESRTSQLIVKALVEVAQGTGTKTVAVFVSDDDTLGLLRQQGVDCAQGYKVGRPKPVAEFWPAAGQAALPPGD
jgi:EAL domain-containing protein (putative c-di-GMP-specific phosphodiesterase class I)/predicted  nucleic acid-binding Zn-ribbon protein